MEAAKHAEAAKDVKVARDAKDIKVAKDVKDVKDVKDAKATEDAKDAKAATYAKYSKDADKAEDDEDGGDDHDDEDDEHDEHDLPAADKKAVAPRLFALKILRTELSSHAEHNAEVATLSSIGKLRAAFIHRSPAGSVHLCIAMPLVGSCLELQQAPIATSVESFTTFITSLTRKLLDLHKRGIAHGGKFSNISMLETRAKKSQISARGTSSYHSPKTLFPRSLCEKHLPRRSGSMSSVWMVLLEISLFTCLDI